MSTKQKMQLPARKPAKASKAKAVAKTTTGRSVASAQVTPEPATHAKKAVTKTMPKSIKTSTIVPASVPASAAAAAKATKQKAAKSDVVEKPLLDKSTKTPSVASKALASKVVPDKPAKEGKHKHKLVRDSFTMPRDEFELIHVLKERALNFKRPTKKSELLRAGLRVLAALDDSQLRERLDALTTLSPGRPKKHH